MDTDEIKQRLEAAFAAIENEVIKIGREIRDLPELGYREEKTSALVRRLFDKWNIEYKYPVAYTGVKAKLKGRQHKYNVCIIGEMDALICRGQNAHKCGHNAQLAAMLGCAYALKSSGVTDGLDGDITLMAVPAEEFIDLDYRKKLKSEGKIQYFGGKQQLISEGAFDDVDMAMMIHARGDEPHGKLYVRGHNLGFAAKKITIRGRAVHGSTPFDGVNALNAAALAILGIHANRETFRDEERIRIHPIITKGGDVVNSVPDEVCIDTYVRGASAEAIEKGKAAVDRAVKGACEIIGASAETEDISGYLPLCESAELSQVLEENAEKVLGSGSLIYGEEITGSSDIGDLSMLIPTVQPSIGGFTGALHSDDFMISNEEIAYIAAAKILAETAAELLADNAAKAEKVKNSFKPKMTLKQYINYLSNEEEKTECGQRRN